MTVLSNIQSLSSYLPELMIVLLILAVFLYESIEKYRYLVFYISCGGLIFASILLYFSNPSSNLLFDGMIINDSLSIYFKWILLLSTLSVIIVSNKDNSILDVVKGEYFGMLLIILLGMFVLLFILF